MEREDQNLEFSSELNATLDDCARRPSCNLYAVIRPLREVNTNVTTTTETINCNSRNSSYQSLSLRSTSSDDQFDVEGMNEHIFNKIQNGMRDTLTLTKQSFSSNATKGGKYCDSTSELRTELSKYKKELKEYNDTTKDLEEKYLQINLELNEMQQKNDRFIETHKSVSNDGDTFAETASTGSEYSLKRKYTEVFQNNLKSLEDNKMIQVMQRRKESKPYNVVNKRSYRSAIPQKSQCKHILENKENEPPLDVLNGRSRNAELKDVYKILKNVIDTNYNPRMNKKVDFPDLQKTVAHLQRAQGQYRNIIKQQQNYLQEYHARCEQAHNVMQAQRNEIEKLNANNGQLEKNICSDVDQLRYKIDNRLKELSNFPQLMRSEQLKYERVSKENCKLIEKLRLLQNESSQLKLKIEDLGRRKSTTINRLKAAERDLKIFKNYNTALKHEKSKLGEDVLKLKDQLENIQGSSKKLLVRQREQNEKQRRDLKKRILELELKLNRSQNSTTNLIQERDSIISELQTQLNTLVHNFEVSQKHIRVLRRHIYSMSSINVRDSGCAATEI